MSYVHADLHTHTRASDGALSPADLVARAASRDVQLLSITDHDTMAGYAQLAATHASLTLVPGVELSTTWSGVGIHIVGLDVDPGNATLRAGLERHAVARTERALRIGEVLERAGFTVDMEAIRHSAEGLPGRPHFAQHLVETGQVADSQIVFKKYLGAGKPGDIKVGWASMNDVVEWITSAGGIATIAHPARYRLTRTKLHRLIDAFTDAGGQALEVISGKQTDNITAHLAKLCGLHGLLASCGSDFHRVSGYGADVGAAMTLPASCEPVWSRFRQ